MNCQIASLKLQLSVASCHEHAAPTLWASHSHADANFRVQPNDLVTRYVFVDVIIMICMVRYVAVPYARRATYTEGLRLTYPSNSRACPARSFTAVSGSCQHAHPSYPSFSRLCLRFCGRLCSFRITSEFREPLVITV